jgi:RNA polymerase sigma-B factor
MSEIANDIRVARWLEEYVQRRSRHAHISPEEKIAEAQREQDFPLETLRARIAEHHAPLVESIARRFVRSGEPFDDLVQEGYLGLLSALENYSLDKGVKFSTYATHFVAGAIRHYLRDRGNLIKEPAWLQDLCRRIYNTSDQLSVHLGRTPHPVEIAQVLHLTESAVEEVLLTRRMLQMVSFDSSNNEEEGGAAGIVDPEKIKSDQYSTFKLPIEDRIAIEEAMERLKILEKQVLQEFFFKDLNQTEVGKHLGISTNYVSHILKNSTTKLRKMLGEADLKEKVRPISAIRDSITNLFTESYLMARLEEEISRAARAEKPLSLVLIVLEGLPSNAQERETVWKHCADAVRKGIRRIDMAGRHGDNGVAVILIETHQHTNAVAERVVNLLLVASDECGVALKVRFGTAVFPLQGQTAQDLFATAKASLHHPLAHPDDVAETPAPPEELARAA